MTAEETRTKDKKIVWWELKSWKRTDCNKTWCLRQSERGRNTPASPHLPTSSLLPPSAIAQTWKLRSLGNVVLCDAEALRGRAEHILKSKEANDQHNHQYLPLKQFLSLPRLIVNISTYLRNLLNFSPALHFFVLSLFGTLYLSYELFHYYPKCSHPSYTHSNFSFIFQPFIFLLLYLFCSSLI